MSRLPSATPTLSQEMYLRASSKVESSALSCIYDNDITVGLNPCIQISQFADDTVIYCPATIPSKSKISLGKTINTLGANLDHLGLF